MEGRELTLIVIAQRAVRRARAPSALWTNRKGKADEPQMEARPATSTNGKSESGEGPTRHGSGHLAPMRTIEDQKKYTITQSIQYTGYSIQGTGYKYTGSSIQGTRVYTQYTVYSIQSTRV